MDKLLDFSHFLIWNMCQLQKLMVGVEEMLHTSIGQVQMDAWRRLGAGLVVVGMVVLVPCARSWGGFDGCSGCAGISLLILWCLMPCPYRTFLLQPSPWWNGKVLSSLSWTKGHSWIFFFFLTIFYESFNFLIEVVFLPGESHGQRSLAWGRKSRTRLGN